MKTTLPQWGMLILLALHSGPVNGEWKIWTCPGIEFMNQTSPPIFSTGSMASVTIEMEETPGNCNGMETYPYKRWYWEVSGDAIPAKGQGQTATFASASKGPGSVTFELVCRSTTCPDCNREYERRVDFCMEGGPYLSPWSCIQGATMSMRNLKATPAVVCLGGAITASASLSRTEGLKKQKISYDCSPPLEVTNSESVSVMTGFSVTGPYVTNGSGLSCTFTPTNPGVGTIAMWAQRNDTNSTCSINPSFVTQAATYTVLKTDLVGHQPGKLSEPGLEISEENEDDAENFRISVNDDNDDEIAGSHRDNQDDSIGNQDDDVAAITLRPVEPRMQRGTLMFAADPAECIQIFQADGKTLLSDYSVDLASPRGDLCDLVSAPVTLYIEGVRPAEDVALRLTYSDGDVSCEDVVRLQVLQVDLDIDSDNENESYIGGWNDDEDKMEDDDALPGKYIGVNDGDIDQDGIPNFADGYDLWGAGAGAGGNLTPMALELKDPINLDTAKIKFTYSCSDPTGVARSGSGTATDPYKYTPASGHLRIWKADGSADRKKAEVSQEGDFIKSGIQYSAQDLGFGAARQVILYVEGINPSKDVGDQRILVEVLPDPDRPLVCSDVVRCTVLKAALVPDWNHDRKIEDTDRDRATAINPFRFWINDDKDVGDVAVGDSDVPGQSDGNASDDKVNGRCDLLDFFPVWLDMGKAMNLLPGSYDCAYVLRQADGAVNFFQSDLVRGDAGNYLIEESQSYGWGLDARAHLVPVVNVPAGGVDMTAGGTDLLGAIHANPDKGVLVLEGKASTTSPLILEIRKNGPTGALLYETQLPLSLSGVEEMYRTVNLRNMTNPGQLPPPSNNSAALSNGKNLVFVHGYQSSGGATWSTAWLSEMFKRSYQSGSRAIFHGVTWRSNEGDSMDYQKNVTNAFWAAPVLKDYVAGLNGDVIVAAHSLGNIVVSSAIVDHDMSVAKFMLCNAAVASEAFDATMAQDAKLINPWWSDYSNRTWAANWYQLFQTNGDSRQNLTWRDRLADIVNSTEAWNFFSTGDEVFSLTTNPGLLSGAIEIGFWGIIPISVNVNYGRYSWQKQEMFKGIRYSDGWASFGGTAEAGWGFEEKSVQIQTVGDNDEVSVIPIYTNATGANTVSDAGLQSNPVFKHAPDWLVGTNALSQGQINFMLGVGIPALTPSMGRTQLPLYVIPLNHQKELNSAPNTGFKPNGWPNRSDPDGQNWLHNDIKNVAYFYTYMLFDTIATEGDLK